MDKIKKLLQKISKKDRKILEGIMAGLIFGDTSLFKVVKVKDTDFFRVRKGNFRIIFHYENKNIIIDDVRLRNDNTYKKL